MKSSLLAATLCFMPVFASAQTVDIETATGVATVPAHPETIVAFDLAAIDTLQALGVALGGLPAVTPPAHLAEAFEGVPVVGTLFEPDFEALAIMAPDLIIAGGRSQTQVEPLSAIAPTVDMTIGVEDIVSQAKSRATAYGALLEREDMAAKLNADLDAAIAEAREKVNGQGNGLILLTNGGKLSAYGSKSRFGWMHDALGLPEAYAGLGSGSHGEAVSFEFIADVNPDWIFVIDRGAAIGQEGEAAAVTLDNPLVAGTTAGERGQIVYLDSARLYLSGGGIPSMIGTIREITGAFENAGS